MKSDGCQKTQVQFPAGSHFVLNSRFSMVGMFGGAPCGHLLEGDLGPLGGLGRFKHGQI